MTEDKLGKALEAAASDAVDRRFTDDVWRKGMIMRRRRQAGWTAGASLGLAATVAAVVSLGGFAEQTSFTPPDPAEQTFTPDSTATETSDSLDDMTATQLPLPTDAPSEEPTDTDPPTPTEQPTTVAPPAPTDATAEAPTDTEPPTAPRPTGTGPTDTDPAPTEATTEEPTTSEPAADVSCSADDVAGGTVRLGETPEAVRSMARQLAVAAGECDQDTLVALANQNDTSLSFGIRTPEEVFALPEDPSERYGTLLSVLTEQDPVYRPPAVDPLTGETTGSAYWVWGDFGPDWRVGIGEDGRWWFFIAGD